MTFFPRFFLIILFCSTCFQACQSTGGNKAQDPEASLWNNRVGNYTYSQAVAEYGPPQSRQEMNDGLAAVTWEKNDFYDSSKAAPKIRTVNQFGQSSPDTQTGVIGFKKTRLTLLFDKENKLRSWRRQ